MQDKARKLDFLAFLCYNNYRKDKKGIDNMERLTWRNAKGQVCPRVLAAEVETWDLNDFGRWSQKTAEHLCEYEDLGYTPFELELILEEYKILKSRLEVNDNKYDLLHF